jgi:hypothetical protein
MKVEHALALYVVELSPGGGYGSHKQRQLY